METKFAIELEKRLTDEQIVIANSLDRPEVLEKVATRLLERFEE